MISCVLAIQLIMPAYCASDKGQKEDKLALKDTHNSASEEQRLNEVDHEANVALKNGDISKAIKLYEDFLVLFPNSSEAMVYLGGVYGKKGDFEKEIELCEQSIQLNPNFPLAYTNLGNAQSKLEKWKEAEKSFLKGYKVAEANKNGAGLAIASYSLSNYYLELPTQDNKKAIHWADICIGYLSKGLVDAVGLKPQSKDSQLFTYAYESATMNKAGAYANMNDFSTARTILEEYLKKYPDSSDVKDMLQSIKKHQ